MMCWTSLTSLAEMPDRDGSDPVAVGGSCAAWGMVNDIGAQKMPGAMAMWRMPLRGRLLGDVSGKVAVVSGSYMPAATRAAMASAARVNKGTAACAACNAKASSAGSRTHS